MDNLRARNLGFETQASTKMLRDTYTLLATTMVPTLIGALVSAQFQLAQYFRNGLIGFIITLVIMFGLIYGVQKNRKNKVGLVLLYMFTFFMGILLAGTLSKVAAFGNGTEIIALASLGTMMIFGGCAVTSSMFKVDVAKLGKVILVSMITIIIAGIAVFIFKLSFLIVALLVTILIISSAFLFYEFSLIKQGYQDSAVSATLGIYISLYNILTTLLQLLGIGIGNDD